MGRDSTFRSATSSITGFSGSFLLGLSARGDKGGLLSIFDPLFFISLAFFFSSFSFCFLSFFSFFSRSFCSFFSFLNCSRCCFFWSSGGGLLRVFIGCSGSFAPSVDFLRALAAAEADRGDMTGEERAGGLLGLIGSAGSSSSSGEFFFLSSCALRSSSILFRSSSMRFILISSACFFLSSISFFLSSSILFARSLGFTPGLFTTPSPSFLSLGETGVRGALLFSCSGVGGGEVFASPPPVCPFWPCCCLSESDPSPPPPPPPPTPSSAFFGRLIGGEGAGE